MPKYAVTWTRTTTHVAVVEVPTPEDIPENPPAAFPLSQRKSGPFQIAYVSEVFDSPELTQFSEATMSPRDMAIAFLRKPPTTRTHIGRKLGVISYEDGNMTSHNSAIEILKRVRERGLQLALQKELEELHA